MPKIKKNVKLGVVVSSQIKAQTRKTQERLLEIKRAANKNPLNRVVWLRQNPQEMSRDMGISVDVEQMVTNCSVCRFCQKVVFGATETHYFTITSLEEDRN